MNKKRPLSPFAQASGQLEQKRLQLLPVATMPYRACVHCNSGDHDFTKCEAMCTHCGRVHARRRCPVLAIEWYTPGGFQHFFSFKKRPKTRHVSGVEGTLTEPPQDKVLGRDVPRLLPNQERRDSVVGGLHRESLLAATTPAAQMVTSTLQPSMMNPERAAMIATSPVQSESAVSTETTAGLSCTGPNMLPLGPKQKIGTSWPSAPTSASIPPPASQTNADLNWATQAVFRECVGRGSATSRPPNEKSIADQDAKAATTLRRSARIAEATQPDKQPRRLLPFEKMIFASASGLLSFGGTPSNAANQAIGPDTPQDDCQSSQFEATNGPPAMQMQRVGTQRPATQQLAVQQLETQQKVVQAPVKQLLANKPTAKQQPGTQPRDTNREAAVWTDLEATIRQAIKSVSVKGKPFNSSRQVDLRVKRAMLALKPVILGDLHDKAGIELEKATDAAQQIIQAGCKVITTIIDGGKSISITKAT